MARCTSDVPVLPAVIATASDSLASGEGPSRPNRTGSGVGSIFAKANHLGAGNQPRKPLSQFDLKGMGQRETMSFSQLFRNGAIYVFVRVSQNIWQETLDVVNVFVSINVPDAAALATLQKNRRDTLNVLVIAFAESLGTSGNDFF